MARQPDGVSSEHSGIGINGEHTHAIHTTSEDPLTVTAADESTHIELFAGAGGLTLGLAAAGLSPDHVFEQDANCCETLRRNSGSSGSYITAEIHQEDVAEVDWSPFRQQRVRLLAAGPPCQPFSLAGKHLADRDDRNQFPAMLRAVRSLQPSVVLIENVPGILRESFATYLKYITRQLENPSVEPLRGETWDSHDQRLKQEKKRRVPEYRVKCWTLNAADYGVAQVRVRVFLIAAAADSGLDAAAPLRTNSRAALFEAQASGTYWDDRDLPVRCRTHWPLRVHGRISDGGSGSQPWVTVRDALAGLPEPTADDVNGNSHWYIPGARLYRGHTGSELDWPAKTIKAGVHGVAGGENVLRLGSNNYRYFTLREMARLQGFPDDYYFVGARSRIIRQIGNAVPCRMAKAVGEQLRHSLDGTESGETTTENTG